MRDIEVLSYRKAGAGTKEEAEARRVRATIAEKVRMTTNKVFCLPKIRHQTLKVHWSGIGHKGILKPPLWV